MCGEKIVVFWIKIPTNEGCQKILSKSLLYYRIMRQMMIKVISLHQGFNDTDTISYAFSCRTV